MTGKRVLIKATLPPVPSGESKFAENNGGRNKGMAEAGQVAPEQSTLQVTINPKDVIGKLQQVVDKLQNVKKLNDQLQAQYHPGSSSWHMCESIDDELHEIAVLLGE